MEKPQETSKQDQIDYEVLVFNEFGADNPNINLIISKPADYKKVWQQKFANENPQPKQPKIDFDAYQVLLIDLGKRTHGGNKFKIENIELVNKTLEVLIQEAKPVAGQMYPSVMTRPFMFVKIDKLDAEKLVVK